MINLSWSQNTPSFASTTISFPVTDVERSTQWYKQLLGEVESFAPAEGMIEFQLNELTWLQLFEGPISLGTILRLEVKDLKLEHQRLTDLGMLLSPIELVPNVVSYFDFKDPDGNQLSFYKLESP